MRTEYGHTPTTTPDTTITIPTSHPDTGTNLTAEGTIVGGSLILLAAAILVTTRHNRRR